MSVVLLPDGRVCAAAILPGIDVGRLIGVPAEGPVQRMEGAPLEGYPGALHSRYSYKHPYAPPSEMDEWFFSNSVVKYTYMGGDGDVEEVGYYPVSQVDVLVPLQFCGECSKGPDEFHWRMRDDFLCIGCRLTADGRRDRAT